MKRLYILAIMLVLMLATFLSVDAQSQRPAALGGDVLITGKTYTFFSYSKLAGQMIRTSWDGAIYSPGAGTNPFTVALTAQENSDGTWSFYYDTEVTTTVDDVTTTETVRYYMNLPQGTGNVNVKAEERCDWLITLGHYPGFYFVKPGDGNNTAALGYNMHMNAGNEYVVVSHYGDSWYPDFYGGVLQDEYGDNVYISDDPEENRVVMADSSSCNWAFVEVDNVPAFLEKAEVFAFLNTFYDNYVNEDDPLDGFKISYSAALALYNGGNYAAEVVDKLKATLNNKLALYTALREIANDEKIQNALASEIAVAKNVFDYVSDADAVATATEKLHTAITNYYSIDKGEVTYLGKNMSFEDLTAQNGQPDSGVQGAPVGWNVYINGKQTVTADEVRSAGISAWHGQNAYGTGTKDGEYIFGIWNGTIPQYEISQTIEGLDNGIYTITAALMVGANGSGSRRTTQRIFGNHNSTYFGYEDEYNPDELDFSEVYGFQSNDEIVTDTELQPIEVRAYVFDGTLTFGVRTDGNIAAANRTEHNGAGGDGWFKVDNFRIYYQGPNTENLICHKPQISRDGETNRIIMTCDTERASIFFTTNGTAPTVNSTRYTGPIMVSENCTIKAIAVKDGYENSSVVSFVVNWFGTNPEPYAVLSDYNTTLTFYYDNQKEARGGMDVGSFNSASERSWKDYSSYITSVVFDASFANCTTLTSTRYWFAFCRNLTSVTGISNLNTANITDMGSMFEGCTSLKSLDLNGFKTDNARYLDMMFYNCSSLTSLDVSGFNTSNVTDMGLMFYSCSGLTTLDLSSFKTDNVTKMDHMFEKCSNLTTIVVSNSWSTAKVTESNDMFTGCTKLVGGRGTTYNANHTDATYAHIDGGTSNPGYFTDKNAAAICETPTISRDGTNNRVIMTCATAGASIYYTTNGTTPTENNTRYTGPITVTKNCTIKAIAIKDGYESSNVATYNVNWFKVATPTFNYSNLKLTISTTTEGATIYYTTDGSTPSTTNSKAQVYSSPISLTGNTTVKAIAVKADYTNSDVATYSFVIDNYTCQAPQISRSGQTNSIIMTSATTGATIYYTTDGTTPTNGSTRYSSPITVDHNQTIRAIAMKDGMFSSAQSQFTVDWFKVATPTFSYSNLQLTISTATTGATIYYTTNGSNPLEDLSRAVRYTNPIQLDADVTIKAAAVKTDFNDSEIATYSFVKADYVCKQPQITRDGSSDRLTMSCEVADAVIYYTTDGSTPTTSSIRYTGPVTMTYNCVVRAIATRSDLFASEVSVFTVDWLTASDIINVISTYSNGVLTLTCSTQGAEIHYEIGGRDATKSSPLYTGPITLTDNREVRYVAYAGKESVSGSFTPTDFTCAPVTLTYDGLNIELSTTEEGASIYYTLDGSKPTTSSYQYRGKISLTELCTINAIATKQYKNDSEVMTEPITYYYDGVTIFLSEAGHVGDAVKWRGADGIEAVAIQCQGQGVINEKDLSDLRAIKALKHLNLKDARFDNNTVPDGAFAGMNIVSIEFPPTNNITTMGNVFSGCQHLAAIIWNARIPMLRTTAAAAGITNPNLLLYVDNEDYAPQGIRNVIVNGNARNIMLTDGEGGCYYCPQEFQVNSISFTHIYSQVTGINKCSGWETIALPFDVQTITHEDAGKIAPFAANDATARPFWLGELGSSGFKRAAEIRAYTPYIISMPNSEEYGNSYILKGKVTFEATNTKVPVTEIKTASKGDHVFTPCFDTVEASPSVYAINKNDNSSTHAEGSVFLPSRRDVKPFEAYIAVPSNGVAPRYIPIRDSDTGIEEQQAYPHPLPQGKGAVFNLQGQRIQMLQKGLNIVEGKKVMAK